MLDRIRTGAELRTMSFPDTELVEGGILHEGARLMIAGDAGIGKSYVGLQLAWESAIGEPWLGLWTVKRPLSTLLIQMEVSEPLFRKRYLRLADVCDDPDNMWMLTDETFDLDANQSALQGTIEELALSGEPLDLVVLDPLYLMHEGDENAVTEIKPTLHIIDKIRRKYGTAFIIIHHVNKRAEGANRPTMGLIRGSSGWAGWVDTIVYFQRRSDTTLSTHLLKARNRESSLPDEAYVLEWNEGAGKFLHLASVETIQHSRTQRNMGLIVEAIEAVGEAGHAKQPEVVGYLVDRYGMTKASVYRNIAELVEAGFLHKAGRTLVAGNRD